jgi:eukaryotic-like serine/threonine-protein kinase
MFKESQQLEDDTEGVKLDRPECTAAMAEGAPAVYNTAAVTGAYEVEVRDFLDLKDPIQSANTVVAFRDIPTAHAQLDSIVSSWRQCANSTVLLTYPSGRIITNDLAAPTDTGNGITVLPVSITRAGITYLRLVAAKANIVIDILLTSRTSRGEQQSALAIVNFILGKIPGPR